MSTLVAGVGNVFFGDDGFGPMVAQRMLEAPLPRGAQVVDYGIRGLHLAYELLDPPDLLLIADAVARGGEPGTLYLIDPELEHHDLGQVRPDAHAMDVTSVFNALEALGGALPPTRIIGCEPAALGMKLGLSACVERAIEPAIAMIHRLLEGERSS